MPWPQFGTQRGRARSGIPVRGLVVTELQPIEVVEAAIRSGISGENYPEEARGPKNNGIEISNWGKMAYHWSRAKPQPHTSWLSTFTLFQSLDGLKLGKRVDRFAAEFNRVLPSALVMKKANKLLRDSDETLCDMLNEVNAVASFMR